MNVLFHTLAGGAVAVLLVPPASTKTISTRIRCVVAFILGILSHGLLDWLPHCYPIASKVDVLLSLALMIFAVLRSAKAFRLILIAAFAGSIFPDVVDLSPAILAKLTGWKIPVFTHLFPWHLPVYSGSVYSGDCVLSNIVHLLFLSIVGVIFWVKREYIKYIIII